MNELFLAIICVAVRGQRWYWRVLWILHLSQRICTSDLQSRGKSYFLHKLPYPFKLLISLFTVLGPITLPWCTDGLVFNSLLCYLSFLQNWLRSLYHGAAWAESNLSSKLHLVNMKSQAMPRKGWQSCF